jgi:hypothetical protein
MRKGERLKFIGVMKWGFVNERYIRMFFLPAYNPELNPDEILNQAVKGNAVGQKRAREVSP